MTLHVPLWTQLFLQLLNKHFFFRVFPYNMKQEVHFDSAYNKMSSFLKENVVSVSTCLPPPASTYEKGKYVLSVKFMTVT